MTGVTQPRDPNLSPARNPVVDRASSGTIYWMGIGFLVFTVILFYLLIATWPVAEFNESTDTIKSFKSFNLFGMPCAWEPDRQMLFTAMLAGALGSLTHTLTSFGDYVGNRELSTNWIWFLVLRIPIGSALALLFYFIVRGGLVIPTIQLQPATAAKGLDATLQVNPYGIAAFAALAGMFSKQATDKLSSIFDTVFAMKKPVGREGALGSSMPITISPSTLTQGRREDLAVTGTGFQMDSKATINGSDRAFHFVNETQGTVTILPEDVAKAGKLELVLTNPNNDTFKATIDVVAGPTNQPAVASSDTDPKAAKNPGADGRTSDVQTVK